LKNVLYPLGLKKRKEKERRKTEKSPTSKTQRKEAK